jgi:choline monooxygenase
MSKLLGERELSSPASSAHAETFIDAASSEVGIHANAFHVTTQLPLSWYFDEAIYAAEKSSLFAHGPVYVGHQLMVPEKNSYHALETKDQAWALVNNGASVELVSNICRHRQAVMLKGQGQLPSGNIVCPLHRWTYDNKGSLIGAPHFPVQPCLHLPKKPLSSWNGLLFEDNHPAIAELANSKFANDFSFDGYVFHRAETTEYNFNWKTFIEVYLEDYHVAPFHPGLGHFVDCDTLEWEYGDWFSVQTVGVNKSLTKPGSDVYKQWHESVLNFRNGEPPKYGAIWMTIYPNVMVEWYPHVLVVSTIIPRGPEKCSNVVEFYYPEEIALFEPEFVEAEQKAYTETAIEDEEICQRMNDGRKLLWREGREEHGPYQTPYEDGMVHFHQWVRRQMKNVA